MTQWSVYLTDQNLGVAQALIRFTQADSWAQQHCVSYCGSVNTDVSDISQHYDTVEQYTFSSEADALLFTLKWSNSSV